jgi:ribosome modulation factor
MAETRHVTIGDRNYLLNEDFKDPLTRGFHYQNGYKAGSEYNLNYSASYASHDWWMGWDDAMGDKDDQR